MQIHELGCEGFLKSYVFKGTKDIGAKQLQVGEGGEGDVEVGEGDLRLEGGGDLRLEGRS